MEKNVVLLIADISGYTRYMLKNSETLNHAQVVITALMNAVIREAQIPLKIAKLEGDAVFLYAAEGRNWEKDKSTIRHRLPRLSHAFTETLARLAATNTCGCAACENLNILSIKFVAHAGKALFHKVGSFEELAGPDVIVLHRLLKNSVEGNDYVLLTEAACKALGFGDDPGFVPGVEHYDDVGDIPVRVRKNLLDWKFVPDPDFVARENGFFGRLRGMLMRMKAMRAAQGKAFHHVHEAVSEA